jgi:ABC-type nickel/cobalt efflux system permease component RcnA
MAGEGLSEWPIAIDEVIVCHLVRSERSTDFIALRNQEPSKDFMLSGSESDQSAGGAQSCGAVSEWRGRCILYMLGLIAGLLCFVHSANAHPLGNFAISQFSAIRVGRDCVEVRYIIDMAEIPAFQEIQESEIVPQQSDASVEAYLSRKTDNLRDGLLLELNGRRVPFVTESKEILFPPGAGGLPTLKIGVTYKAAFNPERDIAASLELLYRDRNFPGRAGWKEVIAMVEPGVTLIQSSVPALDRSNQLSDYPTDLLDNPPQELQASIVFNIPIATRIDDLPSIPIDVDKRAVTQNAVDRSIRAQVGDAPERSSVSGIESSPVMAQTESHAAIGVGRDRRLRVNQQSTPRNSFTQLIATERLGVGIILLALAVAAGLGAFHALEPGHGKTLVAAYLVGSRGTFKHALALGLIVTVAHTAGVYLLGGITLYASHYIIPERLYPLLGVVSGVVITILGAILAIQRYRTKGSAHSHHHPGNAGFAEQHRHGHVHEHDHSHYHTRHGHHHRGTASVRELVSLGVSGGIVPCPAALVVLLSAVSMNRLAFGLLLIVAFSAGLATVLIAIGLLMVYARRFMSRFHNNGWFTTEWLPMTSAAFIFLFGIALMVQSLQIGDR